jgi:hypothetical protein
MAMIYAEWAWDWYNSGETLFLSFIHPHRNVY